MAGHPIESYLDAVAACDPAAPYHVVSANLASIERSVLERLGPDGLADLRATVLLALIGRPRSSPVFVATPEVLRLQEASFERIRATCRPEKRAHYVQYQDRFLKDLALATGRVFPAGARIVQPGVGFPRSLVRAAGFGQAAAFLALMMRLRTNKDSCQLHVHPDELDEFDEAGWRRTLGRIARMLARNPTGRSVYGSSWLYAPELAKTSPRLGYIRAIAIEAGGEPFLVGIDRSGDALETSPTRRRLFETGAYVPCTYAMIWRRDVIITLAGQW